jgi:hypothetical protein
MLAQDGFPNSSRSGGAGWIITENQLLVVRARSHVV